MSGGAYTAFRHENGPTQFGDNKTPVTADVVIYGFVYAAVILAVSFFMVIPGVRGSKEKFFLFIRCSIAIFVLASIMVCNFGQYWETGNVVSETAYRAGLGEHINASIGLHIGLRGVNITLKTDPVQQTFVDGMYNETIDYNERFSWDNEGFLQGRQGFGPYAGKFNQMYRQGQLKGLPYPILWIAEYFTYDDEGLRWGRFYRQAGYYTHILLWLALPLWILTIIFYSIVIPYGCYCSILTGATLLISNIVFASIKNPFPLIIHFADGQITMQYGWSFYLCLSNGLICCTIGIFGLVAYKCTEEAANTFFSIDSAHDVVQEFYETGDTLYGEKTELEIPRVTVSSPSRNNGNVAMDVSRRPPALLPLTSTTNSKPAPHNGHALEASTTIDQQPDANNGVKKRRKKAKQEQQQNRAEGAHPAQTSATSAPDEVIYVNTIGFSERPAGEEPHTTTTTEPRQQRNKGDSKPNRPHQHAEVIAEHDTPITAPAPPPLPSKLPLLPPRPPQLPAKRNV